MNRYQMQLKPNLPLIDETEEDMYKNRTITQMIASSQENNIDDDFYQQNHMGALERKMSTSSTASITNSIEKTKRGKIKKPLNIVFKETAEQ